MMVSESVANGRVLLLCNTSVQGGLCVVLGQGSSVTMHHILGIVDSVSGD